MEKTVTDRLIEVVDSLNTSVGELSEIVHNQRKDIDKLQLQVEQLKNVYYGDK